MNINLIKNEIFKNKGKRVLVSVHGLRNKITRYEGLINSLYPNIFTINTNQGEKSFSYRDLITGDIKIKYM